MSELVFFNNIVPKDNLKFPPIYTLQCKEIIKLIEEKLDSKKVSKTNIMKFTMYFSSRDTFEEIYELLEKWKPNGLNIEYIGNYMNYNPLIHMMASVVVKISTKIHAIAFDNNVNYII